MSFKVLVIPEDPTNNGYILKPLLQAILADAGKPAAKIDVLANPKLNGFHHAIRAIREELPDRYGFWDLWLFLPDADLASPGAMAKLEADLDAKRIRLFCCAAEPEVEIYACAGYREDIAGSWADARGDAKMKEDVFAPLLAKHGDPRRAGAGRDLMINESIKNLALLYQLCPELRALRDRVKTAFVLPNAPADG